ncbi:MAG: fumarate/nitrate reduction transcriptional regulator Fnr [Sinobacterium sp.]|nr:fumarate/nitrate reduction transcriptional regulator Fnr [Sinobacterium sp.]
MSKNCPPSQDSTCPNQVGANCSDCRLGGICLPVALEESDIIKLDEIVKRGRILQKNEYLYRSLDTFTSVFAIRSGYVKTYQITESGEEQITGFYFPGEIIGLDGIGKNRYVNNAKTLESTAICEIPFNRFQELTMELPQLQTHFFQLMSQEITTDQELITMLSKKTAEQRIATFLLTISARNAQRQLLANLFNLPMSRTDMGNFLGLTVETVSRIMSKLAKSGSIKFQGKDIEILNITQLKEQANID